MSLPQTCVQDARQAERNSQNMDKHQLEFLKMQATQAQRVLLQAYRRYITLQVLF